MTPFQLALLLYFVALALAVLDLLVPSGGMLAVLAGAGALASVLFGFQAGPTMGKVMLTTVIVSVPAFVFVAIRVWPHTPIGRRVILGLPKSETTERASSGQLDLAQVSGRVFRAEYPMMPEGQLRISHRVFNVVAEVGFIEPGQCFEIVGQRGQRLVARVTTKPVTPPNAPIDSTEEGSTSVENLLDMPADELGLDSLTSLNSSDSPDDEQTG
ncbi:MAG: hypothetical protein KDB22_12135 [Planctomycetales bacterium]|nr:hypothetical protein [Planctomycetales bacterium]